MGSGKERRTPPGVKVTRGACQPLGVHKFPNGTLNLAIVTSTKSVPVLRLDDGAGERWEVEMGEENRTGWVWHVGLLRPDGFVGWRYVWWVEGADKVWRECLDPYAKALDSAVGVREFGKRGRKGEEGGYKVRALMEVGGKEFDWGNVEKVVVAPENRVIYEAHVRGFTSADEGMAAGGYLGMVRRIPFLKALGVNVVELLPVFEFNENEWELQNPETGKMLTQYWGYSTVAFFAPMNRFAVGDPRKGAAVTELKTLIRELHRAGIQVFLDVVFNHTAEMGDDYVGPGYYGMKTLALDEYYIMDDGKYINKSGCGNTMKCGGNIVEDFVVDCLRYWVSEFRVDGFRFDLASILTYGRRGEPLDDPHLVRKLAKDPVLKDVALIAEPWDCGSLYQVGIFPHYGKWMEWNGKYRDTVRQFIKGDRGMNGEFATRLCGSSDLYASGRKPYHSVNFVTAHDGFSLADLVSYNQKHNYANGESGNDGESHNNSWNCGVEGETTDKGVLDLRIRQMKNFFLALLISAGTPLLSSGDEYGHSKKGNNNCWCQEGVLSEFSWKEAQKPKGQALIRFMRSLIRLRLTNKAFQHKEFLKDGDVTWHGVSASEPPDWGGYNFLGAVFHCSGPREPNFYVAWNAGPEYRDIELPRNDQWIRVVETSLDESFQWDGPEIRGRYGMKAFSAVMLRGRGKWEPPEKGWFDNIFDTQDVDTDA